MASYSKWKQEEDTQSVIEDRQRLLSVLQELTVATTGLFDPKQSMTSFLERIAERLGCALVLCVESLMGENGQMRLVDSVGLSRKSRKSHWIFYGTENLLSTPMGPVEPITLPMEELNNPELIQWNFAVPIEGSEKDPGTIYFFQLYFHRQEEPKKQYHGMFERLLEILKYVLAHRRLYQQTLEHKTQLEEQSRERALLLKREILARAEAEAERTKIAKALGVRDDFISIASHELKTPITSLRLQLQLITSELRKYQSGKTSAEHFCQNIGKKLNISEQQVERLIGLVFGLLDVSKIQAGKLSMEMKEVNLSELVLESINRLSDQFKSSNNEVIVRVESNVTGYWDPFRIEQVINNLIVNAIKYGNSKPIEIQLKKVFDSAVFEIRDHGRGIKKEDQKLIFKKYERVSSAKNVSGLGLGLYIVKQIVTHHQGSIHVQSVLGHGSTFTVRLPLRASDTISNWPSSVA
jgi:signal transduction histidine kinase